MALSNIWGNNRRVIRQGLVVTYTKKLQYATNIHNITRPYWHYERRRTMEFDYLGLTKSAAEACVAAWNKALYRKAWKQRWIGNASDAADGDNIGYWEARSNGNIEDVTNYDYFTGGAARLQYDGGKGWTVTVSIDETLPYNHTPFNPEMAERGHWREFENNPEIVTPAFRHGDPTAMTGTDPCVDFSLDALEYQFALTSARWSAVGSQPVVLVEWFDAYGAISTSDYRLEWRRNEREEWQIVESTLDAGEGLLCFVFNDSPGTIFVRLTRPVDYDPTIDDHLAISNVLEVK